MDGRALLIVGVALVGGAYVIGTAGLNLGSGTPEAGAQDPVVAAHAKLRDSLAAAGRDIGNPANYVIEKDGRTLVGGPVAATEHGAPAFIEDVIAGYARPGAEDLPGRVSHAPSVADCRPRMPARGSRLANVFSNVTPAPVSFHAWQAEDLAPTIERRRAEAEPAEKGGAMGGLLKALDTARDDGRPALSVPLRYHVMDVVVTEAAAPVHLVLQTGRGRVLWNLHLGAGAELSGVTLLGGVLPAVANLPRGVPVEIFDGAAMEACGLIPAQRKRASDPLFAAVDDGRLAPEAARAELEALDAQVSAWNAWFTGVFGLTSEETRIGHDEGALAALVGPLPEAPLLRASHSGLADAPVVLLEGADWLAAESETADSKLDRLISDAVAAGAETAAAAAGGNILARAMGRE